MYAFQLEIPEGVNNLDIALDLISAPEAIGADSSTAVTSQLMVLNWSTLLLYPKGTPTDRQSYLAC